MRRLLILCVLLSAGCCSPGTIGAPGCRQICLPWHPPLYFRFLEEMRTIHWARKCALRQLSHPEFRNTSCDYRHGYEQAFIDVARGGCGLVPPLPPKEYWKECARTELGHARAHEWFRGYADGAPAALACQGDYNQVPTSGVPGFECGFGHSLVDGIEPGCPGDPHGVIPGYAENEQVNDVGVAQSDAPTVEPYQPIVSEYGDAGRTPVTGSASRPLLNTAYGR